MEKEAINLNLISENQLLETLKKYVFSVHKFACSTKNVHRELKESLTYTANVLDQYTKIKGTEATKNKETAPIEKITNNIKDCRLSTEYQKKIQTDLKNIQRE